MLSSLERSLPRSLARCPPPYPPPPLSLYSRPLVAVVNIGLATTFHLTNHVLRPVKMKAYVQQGPIGGRHPSRIAKGEAPHFADFYFSELDGYTQHIPDTDL